jgi:hypothetical protein
MVSQFILCDQEPPVVAEVAVAVALPVVAVPPVPGPGAARVHKARFSNPNWAVPGGSIVQDYGRKSLDAHCSIPEHHHPTNPCRLNRTALAASRGRETAQGRPIGLLLAWLAAGEHRPSRDGHHKMSIAKHRCAEDIAMLSFDRRLELRQWAQEQPDLASLLALERVRRDGEGVEPEGLA